MALIMMNYIIEFVITKKKTLKNPNTINIAICVTVSIACET